MEKSTKIIIFAVAILIIVGSIVFIASNSSSAAPNQVEKVTNKTIDQTVINTTNTTKPSTISQETLSQHNISKDCWIAYKNNVYDITDWLPKHPGSAAAISPYCGTASEFEQAFTNKHGTKKASLLMQVGRLMGGFDKVGETA